MAAIAMAWRLAGDSRSNRVDACLHRRAFLAAYQGLVCPLAGFVCRRGPITANLSAVWLCHRRQSSAACRHESGLYEIITRTFQPDGPEKGGDCPDRTGRLRRLFCADTAALLPKPRAQA